MIEADTLPWNVIAGLDPATHLFSKMDAQIKSAPAAP